MTTDQPTDEISVLEEPPPVVLDCPVMKINLRSLLVGVLFGIVVAFGIAANGKDEPQIGRFQIVTNASANTLDYYYVLDTVTGQVWTKQSEPKLK